LTALRSGIILKTELCKADKQFGTDGASLFIRRVYLIGKPRILYAVLQKQNCVKKYFSEAEASCKKFLWERSIMGLWVIWLLAGLICIGLELFIPGLVIIFFGFGAIFASLFSLFISNFIFQSIIFISFSILPLVFLRKKFKTIFKGTLFYPDKNDGKKIFEFAEVLEPISEKEEGRIKYKGTTWNAVSVSGKIEAGTSVKIIRREGLTFLVEKI